jgi:hypothetical protein
MRSLKKLLVPPLAVALLATSLGAALGSAQAVQDKPLLKPQDHESLAKAIAGYYKALDEDEGQSKALEGLQKVIDTFDKRPKSPGATLSLVRDWERALSIALAPSGTGKKGGSNVEFETDKVKYKYYLWVPKEYAPKTAQAPLILVLPDAGKKPQETFDQAWVDTDLRSKAIVAVCAMPSDAKLWADFGSSDAPGGLSIAMRVLSNLRRNYSIDANRVYLCGMGAGVAAAGRLAAMYPHLFAGVIGRGGDLDALPAGNFRALPTLWSGGAANCTAFAEQSEKLGDKTCTVDPGANEAKIWGWIQQQQRTATPLALRLVPIHARNGRAYWIGADRFDPDGKEKPTLEATADRAANKIVVVGTGIEQVTIAFNDLLVDLSKPVEVVLNGESKKLEIKRSLQTLLRGAYDSSDSGRVYTWSETFVLPKPAKGEARKP